MFISNDKPFVIDTLLVDHFNAYAVFFCCPRNEFLIIYF